MFGRERSNGAAAPINGQAAGAVGAVAANPAEAPSTEDFGERLAQEVKRVIPDSYARTASRGELARIISSLVAGECSRRNMRLSLLDQRNLVTILLNTRIQAVGGSTAPGSGGRSSPAQAQATASPAQARAQASESPKAERAAAPRNQVESVQELLHPIIVERMDAAAMTKLPRAEIERQMSDLVTELLAEHRLQLNRTEQRQLISALLNEMLGLGPLEPLLADETITDIMVNGPNQVYVEKRGKLDLTSVRFRDNQHVLNIAQRIVSRIGRRIDEAVPLVDARLQDGSRVNIIIPPLAIDGPSISIRKFSKKSITLDVMARQDNISPAMNTVLKIAARCRLNILISGGTGSGKTTLLNALSQMIDHGERVVTIEDAAELQLQQPHVVRLETRPANIEGDGEIVMRDLVKNALRMRPDRIILGEIRGGEALDMLQAMNTGHDGSMCTIHANRPREALTRLENMVGMSGVTLPANAVRTQIAAAVNLIVQVSRMRDGIRRITHVTEVVGMEGDVITTQDLFLFNFQGESTDGRLYGQFTPSGLRPHFLSRAEYYGLHQALLEAI